jgi:hypothetical protein
MKPKHTYVSFVTNCSSIKISTVIICEFPSM